MTISFLLYAEADRSKGIGRSRYIEESRSLQKKNNDRGRTDKLYYSRPPSLCSRVALRRYQNILIRHQIEVANSVPQYLYEKSIIGFLPMILMARPNSRPKSQTPLSIMTLHLLSSPSVLIPRPVTSNALSPPTWIRRQCPAQLTSILIWMPICL